MKILNKITLKFIYLSIAFLFISCDDNESYADLLDKETIAVNNFLANQWVINELPSDSIFICQNDIINGDTIKKPPYYKMDEDGNIYMQVINPGTRNNMAKYDQLIYFRFSRCNIANYDWYSFSSDWVYSGIIPEGWGNANDLDYKNTEFRFGNYTLPSSSQWGSAIQMPLYYLGIDCEVNIIIRSQYGYTNEISNVIPYLYNIRYFNSQI